MQDLVARIQSGKKIPKASVIQESKSLVPTLGSGLLPQNGKRNGANNRCSQQQGSRRRHRYNVAGVVAEMSPVLYAAAIALPLPYLYPHSMFRCDLVPPVARAGSAVVMSHLQ